LLIKETLSDRKPCPFLAEESIRYLSESRESKKKNGKVDRADSIKVTKH
jgi:hypothetical protein